MHGLVFAPRTPRALWVLAFIPALVGVAAIGADTVTQGLELEAGFLTGNCRRERKQARYHK